MANWLGGLMRGWPAWAIGIGIVALAVGWILWTYFVEVSPFISSRKPFKGEKDGKK